MAKFSSFGASQSLSLAEFNKRTAALSERLGEIRKPEPRQRANRTMTGRGKPAPRTPVED